MGESKNIIIANCTIEYAGMGIMIFPYKDGQVLDGFEIRNNIIRNIDDGAIHATAGFNIYYLTIPEKELYVYQLKNCRVKHILITVIR